MVLPSKLPGTAVPVITTFASASFLFPLPSLEFTLIAEFIFGAGFKFGGFDRLGMSWTSFARGDECCGEVERWLAFEPDSPPRVEVRGDTRPVWRGTGVSDVV